MLLLLYLPLHLLTKSSCQCIPGLPWLSFVWDILFRCNRSEESYADEWRKITQWILSKTKIKDKIVLVLKKVTHCEDVSIA